MRTYYSLIMGSGRLPDEQFDTIEDVIFSHDVCGNANPVLGECKCVVVLCVGKRDGSERDAEKDGGK